MAIQQVIMASPITGWTVMPVTGENALVSERRAHLIIGASLVAFVLLVDIIPP
jgi:hypothetical protein